MTALPASLAAARPLAPSPDETAALARLAGSLSGQTKPSAIGETVSAALVAQLGAAGAALALRDAAAESLQARGHAGVVAPDSVLGRIAQADLARCLMAEAGESVERLELEGLSVLATPVAGGAVGLLYAAWPSGRIPGGPRPVAFLRAVAGLAALALADAEKAARLRAQESTRLDLELAAQIQRNLLPRPDAAEAPVFGLNRPIREVSGDFFDHFALPDGRIAFALGDVSGKGFNAALLMAKAASLYRCLGKRSDDPAMILGILNREVAETSSHGMFVTMVAGTFDPARGLLRFANAGHEPPLLRRPDRSYQAFPAEAPPLGVIPEITFWTHELDLEGGEFYVFSDGLTEFRYGSDEALGVEGIIQLIEGLAALPLATRLRSLIGELDREGWEMRDDLTVLGIDDVRGRARD